MAADSLALASTKLRMKPSSVSTCRSVIWAMSMPGVSQVAGLTERSFVGRIGPVAVAGGRHPSCSGRRGPERARVSGGDFVLQVVLEPGAQLGVVGVAVHGGRVLRGCVEDLAFLPRDG